MVEQAVGGVQSVYDLIRRELGGVSVIDRENPEGSTVSTTSVLLLRARSSRVGFVFINLSANVMFIRPARAAATTAGIRLGPNGGQAAVWWKEDFLLPAREWNVIADAGVNNQFYVLELVLG